MKSKSIMTQSSFKSRRKIIISLVITILLLGIVSGFTNTFDPDNTVHKANFGETIVMEAEPPEFGSPENYNALENLKFTAYKLHHAQSFRGETDGVAVADIGFTTYSQYLRNTRVVMNENKVFTETVSSSSLKNLGEQKYIEDDIVIFRPSEKVANGNAAFSDDAYRMSFEEFSNSYGAIPNQISKYIINEKTILSVTDENAPMQAKALNGKDFAYAEETDVVSYYVPEKLTADENGNYKFTITLDPDESTRYYRNEVKTLGGADALPVFHSASITFEIDKNWMPLRVTTVENYDIAIPVLGAMNCTGTNVETFTEINAVTEMPECDFYKPYIENAKNDPDYIPPVPPTRLDSPADFLASAFAEYITGEKDLVLSADIVSDSVSAYGLNLSLNLKNLDVQAMLGDLYVKYSDDKVYIRLNGINGYISKDDFYALAQNELIHDLLGVLPDLNIIELLGDDMLSTVFADCEMTDSNGVTQIRMPFAVDGSKLGTDSINIDASMYFDSESKALKSVSGKISLNGTEITITAEPPRRAPRFPSVDGATDLSGILDFIPDIISTVRQKTLNVSGSISALGYDIGVSAYIDFTDYLKIDAVISMRGLDISVKYTDDTIYLGIGSIDVRGTTDDIPQLLDAVLSLTGTDIDKYGDMLKLVMPSTLSDFIGMIKSLDISDDTLGIGLSALTIPVKIELTRHDGMIDGLSLDLAADMFGIKFDASADLDISFAQARDIEIPDGTDFLSFADLTDIINRLAPYLEENTSLDVTLDAFIALGGTNYRLSAKLGIDDISSDIKLGGTIDILGQRATVTYINNIAYLSLGNIRLKLDANDIDTLMPSLSRILNSFVQTDNGIPAININDVLGCVDSITINEYGALVITLSIDGIRLDAVVDPDSGTITVSDDTDMLDISATFAPAKIRHDIAIPENSDKYTDISHLGNAIDKIADILEQKSFTARAEIICNGICIPLGISANLKDGSVRLTQSTLGLNAVYTDGTLFLSLGNIRVSCTVDEIPYVLDAFDGILPKLGNTTISSDPAEIISAVLGMITELSENNGVISLDALINKTGVTLEFATDLSSATVAIAFDGTLIKIDLDAIDATPVEITAPANTNDYVRATELIPAIEKVVAVLNGKALSANLGLTLYGVKLDLALALDFADGLKLVITENTLGLNVVLTENTIYLTIGEIKLRAALNDISDLLALLDNVIPSGTANILGGTNFDRTDILGAVKTIVDAVTHFNVNNGILGIAAMLDNISVTIDAQTDLSVLSAEITVNGTAVKATFTDITATAEEICAPNDVDSYVQLTSLLPMIQKVMRIVDQKSLTFRTKIDFGTTEISLDAELSFENVFKAHIIEHTYNIDITVIGKTVYISRGEIRIAGTTDDIPALLDMLDGVIPAETANAIERLIGGNLIGNDVISAATKLLAAVESFNVNNGTLSIVLDIANNGKTAVNIATDLTTANISANIGGSNFAIAVTELTVKPVSISVSGSYVPLSAVITALKPVMPLISAQGINLNINTRILGVTAVGNVYIFFGGKSTGLIADAKLTLGDLPIRITIENGNLYISIDNGVAVQMQLTETTMLELADRLDYALPGIKAKIENLIEQIKSVTLDMFLDCTSLYPVANGFELKLDMQPTGMDITAVFGISNEGGKLKAVSVDCNLMGTMFGVTLDAVIEDGTLVSLATSPKHDGESNAIIDSVFIELEKAYYIDIRIDHEKYVVITDITKLIAPIFDLVNEAISAKTISLDFDASLIKPKNASTRIKGNVTLSLDPIAVDASIILFYGTADATEIKIVYTGTTLFVKAGNIELSLDTENDFERLYNVLAGYLPDYINDEIAKLLGLKPGASAFSDMSLLLDALKSIASANDAEEVIRLMFSPLGGINSNSAIKTLLDAVRLFNRDNGLTVGITVFGITLNATPILSADGAAATGVVLDTALMGYALKVDVTKFDFIGTATDITIPANAENYVSVIEFIEAINNAVNTFTKTDPNGNITFELNAFDFDYEIFAIETTTDENGNIVNVKDDSGRDKPLIGADGKKVIEKTVKVYNKPGYSALKGMFVKDEQTDADGNIVSTNYKFNLEAHIVLDISSLKNSTPLTVDLYVINNNDHNGIAFIDYSEGKTNSGERISIDYDSIMQIVAAALDIMGVNDEIADMLLGEYRLSIDTAVFDSMDIAGLNDFKNMVEHLVYAVQDIKDGIQKAKNGWDLIKTAGSIDVLNERFDEIKSDFTKAIDIVKAVLASFTDKAPTDDVQTEINGKLFNDIVNGITLRKDDMHIWATVENSIATNTDGISSVTVTQSGNTIDRIEVEGLDVNTAKLNRFDAQFTAGESIEISLPDNYNSSTDTSTYSDFANIKHLLFDVMNTANMLEFEMGDANVTTDQNKIELGIRLLGIESIKLNIRYNVKVRIIDQGEGADPRFKTAAVVELIFNNCTALGQIMLPNGTTRLYFYDNVIYVHGIKSWDTNFFGTSSKNVQYADVAYTVDQIGTMLNSENGMTKLMNEFVFYLLPLREKVLGISMKQSIVDAISNPTAGADPTPTVATVFKGYGYESGTHAMTIGLSELAEAPGSNMLGDLNISFGGKNDGDDNILDNYIGSASITTSLVNSGACTINVRLFTELRNAEIFTDTDNVQKLRSKGLTDTTDGHSLESIISSVIPNTAWQYIWA